MSYLICNKLLYDTITCGLIPCVSHINTISPPKVVTQLPKPSKDLSAAIVLLGVDARGRHGGREPTEKSFAGRARWL
jgi:hypothetical protein